MNLLSPMAVIAASIFAAPPGCLGIAADSVVKETRTEHIAHLPASPLEVTTGNGSISVYQSERSDVLIETRIKAQSEERLKGVEIISERQDDGTLSIHPDWPNGVRQKNEGCSLKIHIPGAVDIRLKSSNGNLLAEGLEGKAILESSNGSLEARDHDGSLDAHTSNGSVIAENIAGPMSIKSSNGKIRAVLTEDNPGPIDLQTSNGAIRVELGEAFEGELSMNTSHGSLKAESLQNAKFLSSGKNKIHLKFGDSEQQSSIRTSNGSIRVLSREEK